MKTLRVTTSGGGCYIIYDATAFGPNGVIGYTDRRSRTLRQITFQYDDVVEEIA